MKKKEKRSAWQIAEDKAVAAMAKQMQEEIDKQIIDEITVMVRGDDRVRENIKNLRKV